MNNKQLKTVINKTLEILEYIGKVSDMNWQGTEPKEVLKVDLLMYTMYLSSSDGIVSQEEADAIGEILDYPLTPKMITALVEENDVYSKEFETKIPFILKFAVAFDKQSTFDMEDSVSKWIFNLFYILGFAISDADGELTQNETYDAANYLLMMLNYINAELETEYTFSDLVKNEDIRKEVFLSDKKGIDAPKKS